MKRLFLIFIIIVLAFNAFPQIIQHYGLKAGAVASTPVWSHESKNDSQVKTKWGIDIGVFAELKLTGKFSLSPEIHFIQKGLKYDIPITTTEFPDGTGEYITLKPNVNYISLPVNIKYTFLNSFAEIYGIGGIRFDFAVEKKGDGFDYLFKQFKDVDYGASLGFGIRTNKLIGVGTGLEFRFSPNISASYSSEYQKITNSSVELLFVLCL